MNAEGRGNICIFTMFIFNTAAPGPVLITWPAIQKKIGDQSLQAFSVENMQRVFRPSRLATRLAGRHNT